MIVTPDSLLVNNANEVTDGVNHATHGGCILKRFTAVHLVKSQTDQRLTLNARSTNRAADLFDSDRLAFFGISISRSLKRQAKRPVYSSLPTMDERRACRVAYFKPR